MRYDDHFQELLTAYSKEANLSGLQPTEEGYCALFSDDDLALQLQLDRNSGILAFFIEVGKVEEPYRAKVYPYLLAANVLWIGTGGATLGVNHNGVVMLCYSEPILPMDAERMMKIMDNLLNTAEDWEENLVAIQQDDVEAMDTANEAPFDGQEPTGFFMRV